ncbi:unnamed protein product [Strongylus vulgaris]|uniref:Uncharacterized protein n=1 Tax=Strongylus vulgaris TaxID=40348 RepID=A0A3P7JG57_STRVU|nr:unnamed protein product [Strongylus vulgaris]
MSGIHEKKCGAKYYQRITTASLQAVHIRRVLQTAGTPPSTPACCWARDGVDGNDMTPATLPDTDEFNVNISDDDNDEEAENTWEDNAQKSGTFSEPVGTNPKVDNCETPPIIRAVFL